MSLPSAIAEIATPLNLVIIIRMYAFRLHYASIPREGNGNPLQYSCLENPRDGGAWWAAIYGVAQSRTRLSDLAAAAAGIHP